MISFSKIILGCCILSTTNMLSGCVAYLEYKKSMQRIEAEEEYNRDYGPESYYYNNCNTYKNKEERNKCLIGQFETFKRLCYGKGNLEACHNLATDYYIGQAPIPSDLPPLEQKRNPEDIKEAIRLFNNNCDLNYIESCVQGAVTLGFYYTSGQLRGAGYHFSKEDSTRIYNNYKKDCDFNYPLGCMYLSATYSDGIHVKKDLKKSKEYLYKSCELYRQKENIINPFVSECNL